SGSNPVKRIVLLQWKMSKLWPCFFFMLAEISPSRGPYTKYVKVLSDFPELPAVTACAHLQWDTRTQEIATIFSYAVPAFINEFQLRGFVDEEGFVRFALIVHGHHSPYLPVFRADGQWHHFCVTWQQENGTWAIYADGKRRASASGLCAAGLAAPQAIYGQGTFIIGQDQDSLGGTFRAKESFSGNITDLHIWQKVLSAEQIEKVRSCWMLMSRQRSWLYTGLKYIFRVRSPRTSSAV
uniref:Pentraxin family member n=1 Tax=Anas zonorhyncha TaxID=75864 RepID=A0A8B9UXM7_9AVES